jgi:hypothetical protein
MPDYLPRGAASYTSEHKGRYVSRQLLKPGSDLGRDIDYPDRVFLLISWDGVRLSRPLIGLLCQLRMIDKYGAFGGMRIGRGNRSNRTKPAPVPLCAPQIPYDVTWDGTRAAVMGSRRLTACAMAGTALPDRGF